MLLLPTVYVEPAATTRVPSDHPVEVKPWRKTVEADATSEQNAQEKREGDDSETTEFDHQQDHQVAEWGPVGRHIYGREPGYTDRRD